MINMNDILKFTNDILKWFSDNWFTFLQTVVLSLSMIITFLALKKSIRQSKVEIYMSITNSHRDLWTNVYKPSYMKRVFERNVDFEKKPITEKERIFTNMLFLHMAASVKAIQSKVMFNISGVKTDLLDILSYPIPKRVFEENESFYDASFVKFVRKVLKEEMHNKSCKKA